MKTKHLAILLAFTLLASVSCNEPQQPTSYSYSFSFEREMEGWAANGIDLDNPPVDWSIERSQDIASDGKTSVRLYLNNVNDQGKIWIERLFNVKPDSTYLVHLEYDLASADWGDMNLWTVITGMVQEPPNKKDELVYQGDTKNNAGPEDGFVWLHKKYDFSAQSGPEGKLYLIIGIWGTWETARTYYVDNIKVTSMIPSGDPTHIISAGLRWEKELQNVLQRK